jgi:hypothetical protein
MSLFNPVLQASCLYFGFAALVKKHNGGCAAKGFSSKAQLVTGGHFSSFRRI